jgi:hypothetical protein
VKAPVFGHCGEHGEFDVFDERDEFFEVFVLGHETLLVRPSFYEDVLLLKSCMFLKEAALSTLDSSVKNLDSSEGPGGHWAGTPFEPTKSVRRDYASIYHRTFGRLLAFVVR